MFRHYDTETALRITFKVSIFAGWILVAFLPTANAFDHEEWNRPIPIIFTLVMFLGAFPYIVYEVIKLYRVDRQITREIAPRAANPNDDSII